MGKKLFGKAVFFCALLLRTTPDKEPRSPLYQREFILGCAKIDCYSL